MSVRRWIAVVVMLCALAAGRVGLQSAGGAAGAPEDLEAGSANYRMDWAVAGVASGGNSASANFRLQATVALTHAGTQSDSAGYRLCAGAQCAPPFQFVFLPVVTR